jgi:hypothetical protein
MPAAALWGAVPRAVLVRPPSQPGTVIGDEVICHNDLLGTNIVCRNGAPAVDLARFSSHRCSRV